MAVSYVEQPVNAISGTEAEGGHKLGKPLPVRVERIESGRKYYIKHWVYPKGLAGRNRNCTQHSFDGTMSREYWPSVKQGVVQRGFTGRDVENKNAIKLYMLLNRYPYDGDRPEYSEGIPRFSRIVRRNISKASVETKLEVVAGRLCHVLNIELGEIGGEQAGWTLWVAHECGFLPLKFVEYRGTKWREEIEIRTVGFTNTDTGKYWYPIKGYRTVKMEGYGTLKYQLDVEEYMPNIELGEDVLSWRFPEGTRVLDKELGMEYVVEAPDVDNIGDEGAIARMETQGAEYADKVRGKPVLEYVSSDTRGEKRAEKKENGDGVSEAVTIGPGQISGTTAWSIGGLIIITVAATIVGIMWRRKRRSGGANL